MPSRLSEAAQGVQGTEPSRHRVDVHLSAEKFLAILKEDVRRGLTGHPKSLQPKYFYDPAGSALFERITQLPEYYLTRVEQALIDSLSEELMDEVQPQEVVELGPGPTTKIRSLLKARSTVDRLVRYVPFDFSQRIVQVAVSAAEKSYPFLQTYGVVGDFEKHLACLPAPVGRRLMVFFGSTIGNLDPPARRDFLARVQSQLGSGGRLLLGVDLVKDAAVLEAAYNDSDGVTVEFNRNILRVLNRAVDSDFRPDAFQHHAFYNQESSRIEMHLAPVVSQTVNLRDLALSIGVSADETIWTESSYKFTRESITAMLEESGLALERWWSDRDRYFALVLARSA